MSNQKTNLEICQKLTEFFSNPENKDLRFFQALSNFDMFKQNYDDRLNVVGVDDPFYMRNEVVLSKLEKQK